LVPVFLLVKPCRLANGSSLCGFSSYLSALLLPVWIGPSLIVGQYCSIAFWGLCGFVLHSITLRTMQGGGGHFDSRIVRIVNPALRATFLTFTKSAGGSVTCADPAEAVLMGTFIKHL